MLYFLVERCWKKCWIVFFLKFSFVSHTLVFRIPPGVRCLIAMFLGAPRHTSSRGFGVWKPRDIEEQDFLFVFVGVFFVIPAKKHWGE